MRIVVFGYVVRGPLGGLVWHHLQYVMGLRRLGHDVFFLEDSDDDASCYDPTSGVMTADPSYGLRFASQVFAGVGLGDRFAYFDAHTNCWLGPAARRAAELLASADVLLNVSAVNPVRDSWSSVPHRVLIDTDPAFTQVRHLTDERRAVGARTHTAFFTFGEMYGKAGCSIPDDGLPWQPTRQPIVLEAWTPVAGDPDANFSTVMQWDSYPPVAYGGRSFGMKSRSFQPYFELPGKTAERLELAVGSASAPRELLRRHGWIVTDPLRVTRTAATFQDFVTASKAEFSIAKHGYVCSNSGWFSERSAAYLASGRPVVTQETGFSAVMRVGKGLLAFDSLEAAAEALRSVSADYAAHCRQAREIAEETFDSDVVLSSLLERATTTASPATPR